MSAGSEGYVRVWFDYVGLNVGDSLTIYDGTNSDGDILAVYICIVVY